MGEEESENSRTAVPVPIRKLLIPNVVLEVNALTLAKSSHDAYKVLLRRIKV